MDTIRMLTLAPMDDVPTVSDRNLDHQPGRLWGLGKEPPLGAHLTTSRRGYNHHGVYVGRGRVVHYSPEEIVRRVRSRLGENDYRLLTNNCEHFCNWGLNGVGRSAQAERLLRLPIRLLGTLFHA